MAIPTVKSGPSSTTIIAASLAMAVLVLIAVIAVVATRGPAHHVVAFGTAESSNDACHVVNADAATAVFGGNPGIPHFVLGSCVYDNGAHELIVAITRHDAKSLFDTSRIGAVVNVPGIGDGAYYVNGRLRVLKGSALMLLTLSPYGATPDPKLLALASSAVPRLAISPTG
jgi:hypothetical protein